MKINAKVTKVLETKSGTNAQSGRNWSFTNLAIEWVEEFSNNTPFTHRTVVSVWKELDMEQLNYAVQQGTLIPVSIFFDTREFNDKTFTDIKANLPGNYIKQTEN